MSSSDNLALERTYLAHERTLMAWIRTSTSLISFGFGIYKFFEYMIQSEGASRPHSLLGPREFALSMIAVGSVVLVVASLQYRHSLKHLEKQYGEKHHSPAGKLAVLISIMAVVFFVLVWLNR